MWNCAPRLRSRIILASNFCFLVLISPQLALLTLLSIPLIYFCAAGKIPVWSGIFYCLFLLFISHTPSLRNSISTQASFSFYSLLLIGILLDVRWGRAQKPTELTSFGAAVTFFPIYLAGPIERATTLLPQFFHVPNFEYARVRIGLLRIFIGLTKKFVIASVLFSWIQPYFSNPHHYHPLALCLVLVLARYWLYWDFSAYIDIAKGAATMIGINVMENFNRPFQAKNIIDFWGRWHISLTTWIRDFLFYPLVSQAHGKFSLPIIIFICFVTMGLWHGLTPGFFVFGVYNAIAVLLHLLIAKKARFIPKNIVTSALAYILNMFFFVSLPMVFLLPLSFEGSWQYLSAILGKGGTWSIPSMNMGSLAVICTCLFSIFYADKSNLLAQKPTWIRWFCYIFWILFFLCFGRFESEVNFSYIKF